jgi:hypothetical protein
MRYHATALFFDSLGVIVVVAVILSHIYLDRPIDRPYRGSTESEDT